MQYLMHQFAQISGSLVCLVISFGFVLAIKKLSDFITPFDDDREIEGEGNFALSLRQAGLIFGLGFALIGPLSGPSLGFWHDVGYMLYEGAAVTVFLLIASAINDHLILPQINNHQAIKDKNVAVGIIELGSSMATGLLAGGSFAGEGGGLFSSVVFFALGQLVLIIAGKISVYAFRFDATYQIKNGNQAAAIFMASFLVSLGIILGASLNGPFTGWTMDLINFGFYAALGLVLLVGGTMVADHYLLPTTTVGQAIEKQRNAASAVLVSAPMIVIALIIAAGIL